jgi:hypothetical protein
MSTGFNGASQRAQAPDSAEAPPPEMGQIARAAVHLAGLCPRLKAIAASMEADSQAQAESASTIAQSAEALVQNLGRAMAELTASSSEVEKMLALVKRISDQTQLLSINARIEAARAAEAGRAFGVVVEEMSQLASDTGRMTGVIGGHVVAMRTSVDTVAAMTGRGEADRAAGGTAIREVNLRVRDMADAARRQLGQARSVHAMGARINTLTETLLFQVGRFRFEAHEHAGMALEGVLPRVAAAGTARGPCEEALELWLVQHPYFEFAYVTDARGRQFVDNIGWRDGRVAHHASGFGRDWSERPWFQAASASDRVCVTDIYRSAATGDYCFTVASALRADGAVVSVVGADVNFQRMVAS